MGFTALAETLDPEELSELMAGVFQSLADEAVGADGTIEKFIGDAIFVIFGAPIAHEDDPLRALRTALAMQRRVAEHGAVVRSRYGRDLGLRIGIHTGIVVAGNVRSAAEYGVMGDTVNVASRLQQQAQPGEILVTQATFRLTNGRFSFREVGPVEVKGKEKPILVYALTGEREVARPSVELDTPLVGRWMELSRLDLAYQSALVGRAEFVAVAGEAGIGKSRLVTEFIGLLEAPREGQDAPRVLRWTYSGIGTRSYAGFVETLAEAFDIEQRGPDALARLARRMAELAPGAHEAATASLAGFLGLAAPPTGGGDVEEARRQLHIAVRDSFAALARERPLVIALEDLHHADTASLELLGSFIEHPPRARMLWLVTYRAMPDGMRNIALRANFQSLVLDPLSDDEASRVVESVLELVPDELRARIVERAGGNPFFIEETIRSLIESGAIVREADAWRLVRAPEQLDVPATLHGVVAARIDRLPPLARECLQVAAVIGPRFGHRVLSAAASREVARAVDVLIDAGLVVIASAPGSRLGRYRFRHAVTQEVAYHTLLVRRRAELHRRVAEAIERVFADDLHDLYPALAHHYALADITGKAADYAWRAAEAALAAHAHGEALRHAEQTATLRERDGRHEDAVRALLMVGTLHRYRAEVEAAMDAFRRALAIAEPLDPRGPLVRELYGVIAETSARWGATFPELEPFIERGLELVGPEPSRERVLLLAARAFGVRRMTAVTEADLERALATAQEALALAEELGVLREVSFCLDAVGYAQRELGRFGESLQTHERRVPIARTLQDSDELIDAHTMVALCLQVVGGLEAAREQARVARELAEATGKDLLHTAAVDAEASSLLLASRFAEALVLVTPVLATPRRPANAGPLSVGVLAAAALGDPAERDFRDAYLATEPAPWASAAVEVVAAHYAGRVADGAYATARGGAWAQQGLSRAVVLPMVALAAARWGIDDAPLRRDARAFAERCGNGRGLALLAHAEAMLARADEAEPLLRAALAEYERLALPFEQALCLADLARLRARAGRPARDLIDGARTIADRIEASPLRSSLPG